MTTGLVKSIEGRHLAEVAYPLFFARGGESRPGCLGRNGGGGGGGRSSANLLVTAGIIVFFKSRHPALVADPFVSLNDRGGLIVV